MKKTHICLIVFILFGSVFNNIALSWDDKVTHRELSEYAADNSVLDKNKGDYLQNLGFVDALDTRFKWGIERSVKKWLAYGANLEDEKTSVLPTYGVMRSVNHFHNPLKAWEDAGLDDTFLGINYTGQSSLLWAQDGVDQGNHVGGDWSWQTIRDKYYWALTDTTETQRQMNFAQTFRGLGHQMHLIQDAAQPDHVRNDIHVTKRNKGGHLNIEPWAKKNKSFINSLASSPDFPTLSLDPSQYTLDPSYYTRNLAPSALFLDTDQYDKNNPSQFFTTNLATSLDIGITEYTNANFFSDNTIFAEEKPIDDKHYFPYPRKSSTDLQNFEDEGKLPETVTEQDGIPDTGFWIAKTGDGETIDHFVRPRYFTRNSTVRTYEGNLYKRSFYRDEKCHEDYAQKLIPRAVGYSAGLLDYFFRGKFNIIQTGVNEQNGNHKFQIINLSDEDMDGKFKLYYDNTSDQRVLLWSGDFTIEKLSSGNNKTSNISVNFSSVTDAKEPGEYMLVFKGRIGNEGVAPYDTEYAVAAQKITPHFLTHVYIPDDNQWDIYEYDLLGNRIYNVTEGLIRGEVYYDGNPNPVDPDELIYVKNSGCLENSSCLHLLTKSTGESINMNRFGVFWWSKDGQKVYTQDKYYDFSSGTWKTRVMNSCSYAISYSSFSQDESKLAIEGRYYNPSTNEYDLYDVLVLTDWNVSHVVDMKVNTRSLVNVDSVTCEGYGTDENFFDSIPDFHPSEDKIIFTSDADGGQPAFPFNIYLADISTGNIQRLTYASDNDFGYYEAVWSPDGQTILMAGAKQDESSEIYSLPASGGTPEKVTSDGVEHYYPKWIRYLGQ